MFELKNKYINDYWFKDNIVDCGEIINVDSNLIPVIISENEIEYIKNYEEHLDKASGLSDKSSGPSDKSSGPSDKSANTLEYNNVKEKLNYNYKIINTKNNNEWGNRANETNRTNGTNSRFNNSDITTRNTVCCHRFKTSRPIISNNRMFDEEKTSKHHELFYQSHTNHNKRQMYNLPKTSRIYDFKSGKRKVLLDSQPKLK